jgi:large subunit ribosomal protein L5
MPDMRKKYQDEVVPALKEKLGYKNVMQVPRLEKIVISTGVSSSAEKDALAEAKTHIGQITGQAAVTTKARKNVSNFKLRIGMAVGAMVTLRGKRMYEFLDRLVHNALPRVRDFRGISNTGFDGSGNYNLGVPDISIFTEIDLDKLKHPLGLNITFVTSARTAKEAYELLKNLDMPFAA